MTILPTEEEVVSRLKTVIDPEIHVDVWTLGLIYDVKIGDEGIDVLMTLTTPLCPYGNEIVQSVEKALSGFGVEERVNLTFEPKWQPPEDIKISLGLI